MLPPGTSKSCAINNTKTKMADVKRKRKVDSKGRNFNETWTNQYLFTEQNGSIICLVCQASVAVPKVSNVKRHYETKHEMKYKTFSADQRQKLVEDLKTKLATQQNTFKRVDNVSRNVTKASNVITSTLLKRMKPFTDGEMVKECIDIFVDNVCPDKKNL